VFLLNSHSHCACVGLLVITGLITVVPSPFLHSLTGPLFFRAITQPQFPRPRLRLFLRLSLSGCTRYHSSRACWPKQLFAPIHPFRPPATRSESQATHSEYSLRISITKSHFSTTLDWTTSPPLSGRRRPSCRESRSMRKWIHISEASRSRQVSIIPQLDFFCQPPAQS
jgi:hypothetical protein